MPFLPPLPSRLVAPIMYFRNVGKDSYGELREKSISLAKDQSFVEVFGDEECAEAVHEHLVVLEHDRIVNKHHLIFSWKTTSP